MGGEPLEPTRVKVAAVQVLGYDKADMPRPGFDPSEAVIRFIKRAADDGAQLVVFPEYLLGRISVPGPQTERIAGAAAAGKIYVIVGCWEVFEDGLFANTALLFDRSDSAAMPRGPRRRGPFQGQPPWSKPPQGKDDEWFLTNDPEWKMNRGEDFPVFDLDFGRIGILTCYDGWFPESSRILCSEGPRSWSGSPVAGVGGGLHRQVCDVPGRGGDGHHQPSLRVGDDDRPVARGDPRRLHGTERGLHHRHDRPGAGSKGTAESPESPAEEAGDLRGNREADWHGSSARKMTWITNNRIVAASGGSRGSNGLPHFP